MQTWKCAEAGNDPWLRWRRCRVYAYGPTFLKLLWGHFVRLAWDGSFRPANIRLLDCWRSNCLLCWQYVGFCRKDKTYSRAILSFRSLFGWLHSRRVRHKVPHADKALDSHVTCWNAGNTWPNETINNWKRLRELVREKRFGDIFVDLERRSHRSFRRFKGSRLFILLINTKITQTSTQQHVWLNHRYLCNVHSPDSHEA